MNIELVSNYFKDEIKKFSEHYLCILFLFIKRKTICTKLTVRLFLSLMERRNFGIQRAYELDVFKTLTFNHKGETNLHILLGILT